MNQPPLFEVCEIHANGAIATHAVDFKDGSRPFLVCRSCAYDAPDRCPVTVKPIDGSAA